MHRLVLERREQALSAPHGRPVLDERLVAILDKHEVDYVVLARYMRILPPASCWKYAGGRIINLSSSVVGLRAPTYAVYAATKAGVEAMTHILSKELRGRNITVNAVAPGPTATALFLDGKPQEVIDHLAKMAPLERLGRPEDIAGAVAFLAGPDGTWINGQVLRANGGII